MARRSARGTELKLSTKGTDKNVTGAASTDLITNTAHGYIAGDTLVLSALNGGAGLVVGKRYFVSASGITANDFKLAHTPSGTPIDFTSDIVATSTLARYTFTKIIQLKTITGPSISRGSQDVSDHDSSDYMDFLADGLADPGEITFEGHLDPKHATHDDLTGLLLLMKNGLTVPWDLAIKERGVLVATFALDGFLTAFEPEFPSDGPMALSGSLKVTGPPVLY